MSGGADNPGSIDPSQLALALERLRAVSSDVAEMKSSMVQMAGAVTRLAVMEERLGSSREAQERAFTEIADLKSRIKQIEATQPAQAQTTKWANQVVSLLIAAAVGGAIVTGVYAPQRSILPQTQSEPRNK
jgi:hypothetical protein